MNRGRRHPVAEQKSARTFSWRDSTTWHVLSDRLRCPTSRAVRVQLQELFDGAIVYHAARPADVMSYYRQGLMLNNRAALRARAREIFLSGEFPELTEADLAAADAESSSIDDDQAFVSLDDAHLVTAAGHYLIYGSEFLCGIAAALGGPHGRDYRQVLKRFGVPTVFRLRLPFVAVSKGDFAAFVDAVHHRLSQPRDDRDVPGIDFTFRLRQPLPRECVLGHFHPHRIVDPLLGMTPYCYVV